MPEAIDAAPVVTQDGGPPLGAAPAQPTQAPGGEQGQPQQPSAPVQSQQVVTVPTSAMKRIKDEARAAGEAAALDSLAKQAGYGSHVELVNALAQLKGGGQPAAPAPQQQTQPTTPPPAAAPAQPGADPLEDKRREREVGKYERMIEKLTRDNTSLTQKYTQADAERKKLKEDLDAKEAEMHLRELAVSTGVTDVDYALRLFNREVESKSEAELAKFNEKEFFSGLRATRPYLFGETVRPATTGPGAQGAPPAQRPGQVQQQAAGGGAFDARNAKPGEIQDRLRKMGITPGL